MRIKCNMCVNESGRKCVVRKTTVNTTKSRKCNDYEFEESREIARLERKARVMDQQEAKAKAVHAAMVHAQEAADAHPSTGDLSRFKSSATK